MGLVAGCSKLGTPEPLLWRMGLPDGRVAPVFDDLGEVLNKTPSLDDLRLGLWGQVLHLDPDDCGDHVRLAAISTDADVLKYAVWAWLLARRGPALRTERHLRKWFRTAAAQTRSFSAFASQIRALRLDQADHPWPAPILRPLSRPFEVLGLGGSNK
jgi:hypothetical protein